MPSNPYVGSWAGTLEDDGVGRGLTELTIADDPNLSGSWTATILGTAISGASSLIPAVPGDTVRRFALLCGTPPAGGSAVFTATLAGTTLQGPYSAFGCGALTRGTIRLTKR